MSFGIPQPPNRPPPPPVHRSLPRPPQVDYNNYDDNGDDDDIVDDDNGDDNYIVDDDSSDDSYIVDDHCTKSTSVADGQWQDLRPAPAAQFQEGQQVFCILYLYFLSPICICICNVPRRPEGVLHFAIFSLSS